MLIKKECIGGAHIADCEKIIFRKYLFRERERKNNQPRKQAKTWR